jgi:hypothetical protein
MAQFEKIHASEKGKALCGESPSRTRFTAKRGSGYVTCSVCAALTSGVLVKTPYGNHHP